MNKKLQKLINLHWNDLSYRTIKRNNKKFIQQTIFIMLECIRKLFVESIYVQINEMIETGTEDPQAFLITR